MGKTYDKFDLLGINLYAQTIWSVLPCGLASFVSQWEEECEIAFEPHFSLSLGFTEFVLGEKSKG